jgi:hypothetical protein
MNKTSNLPKTYSSDVAIINGIQKSVRLMKDIAQLTKKLFML